jgi:hypothetical protein
MLIVNRTLKQDLLFFINMSSLTGSKNCLYLVYPTHPVRNFKKDTVITVWIIPFGFFILFWNFNSGKKDAGKES